MQRNLPLLLAVAIVAAGCEQTGDPIPITTPIAPPSVTETFSGTLLAFGTNFHSFQVSQNSEVHVTLKTLTTVPVQEDPNASPPVVGVPATPVTFPLSVRVGQSAISTFGVTCSNLKSVVTSAGSAPQIKGQALAGTFCVAIADPDGILPHSVNYVITVSHG